jgi:cobalt-zinc-cadmium efflux system protein
MLAVPAAHHAHHHHQGHAHTPNQLDLGRAFAMGIGLNTALVIGQTIAGFIAQSTALLADAGHNFGDVLGLVLAWWASRLARSAPTARYTYGLRSASILAAVTNAAVLLVTMGMLAWEAITRLAEPHPVSGWTVIVVAGIGIVVNAVSAWPFLAGRQHDLNVRAAFQHLAADAGVSLGVVIAGVAMLLTGRMWIDPVVGLLIVAAVIWSTWNLLRESLNLALHAAPSHVDVRAVYEYLSGLPSVSDVHDLHVWAMSTTETALTVHLMARPGESIDGLLPRVTEGLQSRFQIQHVTIQIETPQPIPMTFRSKER